MPHVDDLFLVQLCNAQQQKFGAPLPRATNNTAVGFKSNF